MRSPVTDGNVRERHPCVPGEETDDQEDQIIQTALGRIRFRGVPPRRVHVAPRALVHRPSRTGRRGLAGSGGAHHHRRWVDRQPVRNQLRLARDRVAARQRPSRAGFPGPERRRGHDRVPRLTRDDRRAVGADGDRAGAGSGERVSPCCRRNQPLQLAWRDSGLARPDDRLRDYQLRQGAQPGAERHQYALAGSGQRRARARPAGRGRGPGGRERRGLRRRPGHSGRNDRGTGHSAAHLWLADGGRDAADHRRSGPDPRGGADRTGHPPHHPVEHLAPVGTDDRSRRRDRLCAVHRHPLPRELPHLRRRAAVRRRGDGHVRAGDLARRRP
jgi:hypothetical protein